MGKFYQLIGFALAGLMLSGCAATPVPQTQGNSPDVQKANADRAQHELKREVSKP